MAGKRTGLGKGLGALLSDTPEKGTLASDASQQSNGSVSEIAIEKIAVNPYQPRTDFEEKALNELAESIKVQGIIQPITVRRLSEGAYQLISGERRLQASKIAGLKSVPTYVRTADDQQMLEMALIENIQRENLNAMEIALSYQRLLAECDLKQEELGDRVGKDRTTVNNYLRLLKLPPDIQLALRDGKISMGHARAIIPIENVSQQLNVFKKVISEAMSVRKVEEYVRSLFAKTEKPVVTKNEDPEIARLQSQLASHFGTKIRIKSGKDNKGEISIPYDSTDDLNRILDILSI